MAWANDEDFDVSSEEGIVLEGLSVLSRGCGGGRGRVTVREPGLNSGCGGRALREYWKEDFGHVDGTFVA